MTWRVGYLIRDLATTKETEHQSRSQRTEPEKADQRKFAARPGQAFRFGRGGLRFFGGRRRGGRRSGLLLWLTGLRRFFRGSRLFSGRGSRLFSGRRSR